MDPRDERFRDLLQALPAEPSGDEARQALVGAVFFGGDEGLHSHAQLPRPGYEARAGKGHDHRRDHKHHAVGQPVEASAGIDICPLVLVVRREKIGREAHAPYEIDRPVFFGEEAVRPRLNGEAVYLLRAELAAGDGRALKDGELYAFLFERYCAGEGGDSAADDCDPHYCPCASRSRRTALQAAMKGGYVLRDGTRENASPSDAA